MAKFNEEINMEEIDEELKHSEPELFMEKGSSLDFSGGSRYVKFRKPFQWEDDTYNGLDLSGLEALTARDLEGIEKRFYRMGITSFNPENTVAYAKVVAQAATGMPIEFFDQLPVPEIMEIKREVVSFFFS